MRTEGVFEPETVAEAREAYEAVGPAARTTVREVAKAMGFDEAEYDDRVDAEVVETAREAIFASLLAVRVGDSEAFAAWCADHPDYEVAKIGSENVPGVVWHAAPFASTVVAATYAEQEAAAVATLRRQAFGRLYRERLAE